MSAKLIIAMIAAGVVLVFIFRSFWNLNDTASKDDLGRYDSATGNIGDFNGGGGD